MKAPFLLFTACFALASTALAQDETPVTGPGLPAPAATHERLDRIVERYESLVLYSSPARLASFENRAPRRWPDASRTRVAELGAKARALKDDLLALEDVQASADAIVLGHLLDELIMDDRFDTGRIPFTGDWGFHAEPVFAAVSLRLKTVAEAEAWIARLNDLPRYFSQNTQNMRRGLHTGWVSHTDPLGTVIEQVSEQATRSIEESDFWRPLENLPDTIDPAEKARLQDRGRLAVGRAISAYATLQTFLEEEYAPAARTEPGIRAVPEGLEFYREALRHHTAGAGYSAEEIHALGVSEVERIRAEMQAIIEELHYPGTFDEFLHFLRTDPEFYARTPQDLLEKAALISKRLDAILPAYFGTLPRLTYGVVPVPASIAPGYTTGRYSGGDANKGIPGNYLVNTYALDQRPLYELPALSAHEAVPGHHLQIALAQELENVPSFRRAYYATAFGEGWGLYAETLAGEAGIYQTPYERFGALSYEMWRACRLVADTGMHLYGWSREEAETCFEENSALSPLNIKTEVTRYIGWPGQATAYKIGELKILELRTRAREALGERFDIRAFHDAVLGAGSLPLDALEARIDGWISRQQEARIDLPGVTAP